MATTTTTSAGLDYNAPRLFNSYSSYVESAHIYEHQDLLPGFPPRYSGEFVWSGSEMTKKEHEWITILSEQDQKHIIAALHHFQNLNLGPESLSPKAFPLPQELHDRLRKVSHDVHNGRGFSVLRGLDLEALTDEDSVLVYAGISCHVAPVRGFQDKDRQSVICHVVSEEQWPGAEGQVLRPAFTNGKLAFHTDLGDILSLFTMDTSSTGGSTVIASSPLIYNEIARVRPDLLQELGNKWVSFASQNYHTDGTPLINNAPGDKLVFQYSRLPVTGFRKKGSNPTIPVPTQKRLEAMNMIEEIARKHSLPLNAKRGDIAYINNLCIMHARDPFDLDAEGNPLPSKRHLAKMMLKDPELNWDLPESLSWYTELVFGPNRECGDRVENWQLKMPSTDEIATGGHIWVGSGPGGMANG